MATSPPHHDHSIHPRETHLLLHASSSVHPRILRSISDLWNKDGFDLGGFTVCCHVGGCVYRLEAGLGRGGVCEILI
jgi:hypothetical protein